MSGIVLWAVAVILAAVVACGPAPAAPPAAAPAAASAPQPPAAQPAAKPAAEPAKPAAQPAKLAAEPAKPAAAPAGQKLRILYGSSAPPSSYYIHAVALARLWNMKVPEVEVTNVEAGGCGDHLRRMDKGEFLTGNACPDMAFRAWKGLEEFKDRPSSLVQRFLFVHSTAPQGWVVRRETNITKIEELEGKDFTPGNKGSATEKQTQNVMEVLGIKPKYYSAGMGDMIQAIKDRRVVGMVKLHSGARVMDPAVQEVNLTVPLRELSFTPEQEQKVLGKFPYYSFMTVEKDQLSRGYPDRAIRALPLVVGVAAHKDVSEDIAYKLTKVSIEDNTDKGDKIQASAYPALKGIDFVPVTLDTVMTPLHAGAVRYFKEIGKQIKPEQMPPEIK